MCEGVLKGCRVGQEEPNQRQWGGGQCNMSGKHKVQVSQKCVKPVLGNWNQHNLGIGLTMGHNGVGGKGNWEGGLGAPRTSNHGKYKGGAPQ